MPKKKDIYLIHGEFIATVTVENNKVTKYKGDQAIIDIVKPMFESPITTLSGGEDVDEEGRNILITYDINLKPGDSEYIQAALLERVFPSGISVATDI